MTDKHSIVRLSRVAQVRGLRLSRAAEDARLVHEARTRARYAAEHALARQAQVLAEAREMFAREPACPQAKLWLSHSEAQKVARAETVIEAENNANLAEITRAESVRAVARHQARSDRIDDHHNKLRRADALRAETRTELDTATPAQGAIL